MRKLFTKTIVLVVLITLAAGCGRAAPTAAPVSPTASPAPATPAPPTATPIPPTATSVPPTPVPTALPDALTVTAPPGNPPTLDGTLSPGEWDSARREKFSDGSELLLMQNGGYLYLGIRVNLHTIWSVYLDRGDGIAVLHSSGSLGTAVYKRTGSGWQRTRTFDWTLRDKSNSETARQQRKQFLEQEGWLASLGTMGKPEDVEFQLAMPRGSLRLAVAFPWPPSFDKAAVWPVGVDDDVRNMDLLHGDAPAEARFSPERWAVVTVAGQETAGPTPAPASEATPIPPGGRGGGLIAFVSNRDGNDEIYIMNADGAEPGSGAQRNLTHHPASDDDPHWSPAGSQIAFSSDRTGNYEIYVMDADGANLQQLTQNPAVDAHPAWSPDGTQIAFVSLRDGNAEIYVMNADGSNPRRLTNNQSGDDEPDWSPDGTQIAFASAQEKYADIYVINSEGSGRRQLTDAEAHDFFPRWSPDGGQIAFLSTRDGGPEEIYLMDADGTNQRRLTANEAFDGAPSWSPDGAQLVFASDRDGNHELYVMDSDGSSVRRLTDNSAADSKPAWRSLHAMHGRTNTWIRTFEGSNYGALFDIALTEDGNILAVGTTNHLHVPPYSGDALLMKLTLEGDLLWERTWGGEGYEQAWSVALADDGGYYLFGETDSYGAGDRDFFLLKVAEDGSEEWFKTYGGAGREWPYGMLPLSNGDLLFHGFIESEAGSGRDQYALRLRPDGGVIWEHAVEIPGEELVIDALETAEGDLVLAVIVEEDGGLVKLDASGRVLWTQRYELAGWQYASQVAQTGDGGFLLVGFSMSSGSRRQADTWLARCTLTGELDWETSFGDPAYDDYGTSLIRLEDGTYLIGSIANGMLLSRVDQDGNVLWRRSLAGQAVYGAAGLIELEDGGYLVAGFIQLVNGRSYDAILLRTDAE